ncbi:MATE family efflux transporter [Rhodoferax ferrireducens]|uniref:MATE family efflux transporter n=1 Tax=Rhodoferax ferrireducens TaxID=192843 RepID=UPI00298D6A8C|nr:MATE family efflux transporter [Rhodoferax ferrireducens]WPC66096.1 MATE family efflux transporter [Rhodoferax ferrireducens]
MPSISSLRRLSAPAPRARIGREARALWQLAWPILIGQLANVGMSVVEVAMAGHASANDLAGVALGVSIWNMVIVTLMGVMMAVSPVVAHLVGAREFSQVPHVVRQALWQALGVGLIAVLLANLAGSVFDHLALLAQVRDLAKDFVVITSLALPAFAAYRVLYGYSISLNQTKPVMVIALGALLLNVVVNWLLVFGKLGLPRLGGLGCAWSTLVCVWFNLLALLWWMRRASAYRSTWPFARFEWPHWPQVRSLLHLGLPIGITYFAETSAFSLIALLIAKFGSTEMAAHQIALNFSSLVFMLPLSLGLALLTRVGQALGAGEAHAARFRAWVGVAMALAFAVLSATGMALFNGQIAAAYTSDEAVAGTAAQLLILAAFFQLSDATQVATSCAIRGYKVTRAPMLIQLTAFWVFSLPLGYALGLAPKWLPWAPAQPMAARGFWIALVVGLTVAALGLSALLRFVARQHLPPDQPSALPATS